MVLHMTPKSRKWQTGQDSNLDSGIQSPKSCRWTTRLQAVSGQIPLVRMVSCSSRDGQRCQGGDIVDSDRERQRLGALREHLVRVCRTQGPIPFARFMEVCLYHPELGYYTAGPPPMGPQGDYLTYPSVHPAFGRLLGRQVMEVWDLMGRPFPFALVEMGGGRGQLAKDMLETMREKAPAMLDGLRLKLVDRSPGLLSIQQSALPDWVKVGAATPEEFFSGPPITGCVFSNELVDALPVHLVEMREGRILEVFVEVRETEILEVLAEPSDPRILQYLEAMAAHLVEGQRVEVGLAASEWIEKVGRVLERGVVITVDFGYSGQEAFHPMRSGGTLMAYTHHLANSDPYKFPGGQDLTAHVNFSALIWAGKGAGLGLTGLVPQDRFLISLGLLEEMEAQEARRSDMSPAAFWAEKLALRRLMMPQSPRGGFQVLIQHKGWEPQGLRGLSQAVRR